jgi:hypothetical protein
MEERKMKLTLKIGSLAIVGLLSVAASAQAVRPRPEITVKPEIAVKPGPAVRGQGLETQFLKSIAQPKAVSDKTCGESTLAQIAAKAGGINIVTAETAVSKGILKGGKGGCEIAGMNEGAQENWAQTGGCLVNNGGADLPATSTQYAALGAGCMEKAFEVKGGDVQPVANPSAASRSAFGQTRGECQLFR